MIIPVHWIKKHLKLKINISILRKASSFKAYMLLANLLEIAPVVMEKFTRSLLSPLGKQSLIPLTQGRFVSRLVEINPMVLEKKILLLSSLRKGYGNHLIKPRRWRSGLKRSPRKWKFGCSNPSRDSPKSEKQAVTAPLPNARK